MDLLSKMVEHRVWLVGEMVSRAATLTDGQLDASIEISVEGVDDDPTLRSLLSRLIGQMGMWNAAIDGRVYDWDVERAESIDSMRPRLAHEGATYLTPVHEIAEQGRLDEIEPAILGVGMGTIRRQRLRIVEDPYALADITKRDRGRIEQPTNKTCSHNSAAFCSTHGFITLALVNDGPGLPDSRNGLGGSIGRDH